MAEPNHTQLRLSLGSYVLGSLEPADRAALDAHLPGCPACREELASYAAIPALMSRVSIDQVHRPTPQVPPTVLNRALDAVAAERDGTVTQLRRWRRATVLSAAAAAIVAVVFGATILRTQTPSPPDGTPLVAAAGVSASGSAFLQAKPWGTAVSLQLHGLPLGDGFTAWVTAPNGTRSIAATWTPTPDGHATLTGAANITDTTHAALQITQGNTYSAHPAPTPVTTSSTVRRSASAQETRRRSRPAARPPCSAENCRTVPPGTPPGCFPINDHEVYEFHPYLRVPHGPCPRDPDRRRTVEL